MSPDSQYILGSRQLSSIPSDPSHPFELIIDLQLSSNCTFQHIIPHSEVYTRSVIIIDRPQEPSSSDYMHTIQDENILIERARIITTAYSFNVQEQAIMDYLLLDHLDGYMRVDQLLMVLFRFSARYGRKAPRIAAWLGPVIDRLYGSCRLAMDNLQCLQDLDTIGTIQYCELRLALHSYSSCPVSIHLDEAPHKSRKVARLWG